MSKQLIKQEFIIENKERVIKMKIKRVDDNHILCEVFEVDSADVYTKEASIKLRLDDWSDFVDILKNSKYIYNKSNK